MQAITTKYLGPTSHRGSRISAICAAGRTIVAWNHELGVEANHDAAAQKLIEKYKWYGEWQRGELHDSSGNAYVCVARGGDVVDFTRTASK